jgi:hypothetical protein
MDSQFKKGDFVIYARHFDKSDHHAWVDAKYFVIGKVYEIRKKDETVCYFEGVSRQVSYRQIEKIPDTKLNRVLYPEAFGGNND